MKKVLSLFRSSLLWILLLPYSLFYFGAGLNQLVFFCNDGKFPVRQNAYVTKAIKIKQFAEYQEFIMTAEDPKLKNEDRADAAVLAEKVRAMAETEMLDDEHALMTPHTHLNLLGDIINLHGDMYSIGDGGVYAGHFLEGPGFVAWLAIMLYRLYKEPQQVA